MQRDDDVHGHSTQTQQSAVGSSCHMGRTQINRSRGISMMAHGHHHHPNTVQSCGSGCPRCHDRQLCSTQQQRSTNDHGLVRHASSSFAHLGHIVHFAVDGDPAVILGRVLCDLLGGQYVLWARGCDVVSQPFI